MFRCSIRELALAMLAAAMGIAWIAERSRVAEARGRLDANVFEIRRIKAEAESRVANAEQAVETLKASLRYCDKTDEEEVQELARHGLALYPEAWPLCTVPKGPKLSKRNPDGTYSEVEKYGSCEVSPYP